MKILFKTLLIFIPANLFVISIVFSQGTAINSTGVQADSSAMLDVSSDSQGILVPRMTETQKLLISNPANGLLIYQTDATSGFWYYNGSAWTQSLGATGPVGPTGAGFTHYPGEQFGGGIVFSVYKDPLTGEEHGLIVSIEDLLGPLGETTSTYSNVTGAGIGPSAQMRWNGSGNTAAIVGQAGYSGAVTSAVQLCKAYSHTGDGGYFDWYLPAVEELRLIYNAYYLNSVFLSLAGGMIMYPDYYWSSTEYNNANPTQGWVFSFFDGWNNTNPMNSQKSVLRRVRAIRKF